MRVRSTPRERRFLALAGVMLGVAYLNGSPYPALFAMGCVIYHALGRAAANAAVGTVHPRVRCSILGGPTAVGVGVVVETVVDGIVVPGLAVHVEPLRDPRFRMAAHGRVPDATMTWRTTLVPLARGRIPLPTLRVSIEDAAGRFRFETFVREPTRIPVHASADRQRAARALARKKPLRATRASPLGLLQKDPVFDGLREYAAGDRLRDVDWKSLARHGRLVTKRYEGEHEATVMLILDTSRTMRERLDGEPMSRLDHALEMVSQLAEAALNQRYAVAVLAHDERRITAQLPPGAGPAQLARIRRMLLDLPTATVVHARPDAGAFDAPPPDGDEQVFARATKSIHVRAATHAPGILDAAGRAARSFAPGSLLVILLTDLETMPDASLAAAARLTRLDHRVIVAVFAADSTCAGGGARENDEARAAHIDAAFRARACRVVTVRLGDLPDGILDAANGVRVRARARPHPPGSGPPPERPPERGMP